MELNFRYSSKFSVGLTGGIGSGKTTVSDHFQTLGVEVIDADEVSRAITAPGEPVIKTLSQVFGKQILHDDESLNRSKLRQLVFSKANKKQQLEDILHPLIRQRMIEQAENSSSAYLIFSIPLLTESKLCTAFDRVLVIEAPDPLRIKWIKQRSQLDEDTIYKIIAAQASSEQRLAIADDVIVNDKTLDYLYQQIDQLHQLYLSLADQVKYL